MWGEGRKWWLRRVAGLFAGVYAIAQAAGFPQSLFVWARCMAGGGHACEPFRQAVNDIPSSLWTADLWRLFNVALFIVCLVLVFDWPRRTIRWPSLQSRHDPRERTEHALANADAQERLMRNISDLGGLLAQGRALKPPWQKRWSGGDISPAVPPGRIRYDGFEGEEGSGVVLVEFKG